MPRPDRLDADRCVASFQHRGQRHVFSILQFQERNTATDWWRRSFSVPWRTARGFLNLHRGQRGCSKSRRMEEGGQGRRQQSMKSRDTCMRRHWFRQTGEDVSVLCQWIAPTKETYFYKNKMHIWWDWLREMHSSLFQDHGERNGWAVQGHGGWWWDVTMDLDGKTDNTDDRGMHNLFQVTCYGRFSQCWFALLSSLRTSS